MLKYTSNSAMNLLLPHSSNHILIQVMLKRYVLKLGLVRYFHRESKRKKEIEEGSMSLGFSLQEKGGLSLQEKELKVRIVHAGGTVELYEGAIPCALVLKKHPGMSVATPEVFKRPHESLLRPEEVLLPGQKFYLVPHTTVKKLRRKHPEMKSQIEAETKNKGWEVWNGNKLISGEECGYSSDVSICSAKDFYVSKEKWSNCFLRRWSVGEKAFTPPIKKVRLLQGMRWEPSLTSVEEISP